MRTVLSLTLTAAALAAGAATASAQSTTRIETRPFYGATVTIEEGVRVFRPLPPDQRVIINPDGQAPVSLGFNETNVYERRVVKNYNYNQNSTPAPRYTTGGYWGGYGYGRYGNGYGYKGGHINGHGGGGNFGGGHGGGGKGGH